MSNYAKIVDYAAKDSLLTGNPSKIVKGTELGAEFDAIAVAVATKANSASPVFTGVSNFAAGTVGAPSIYLSTDTTTGWYRIGANNWGFAVSGAKVLDIASTGLAVTGTSNATATVEDIQVITNATGTNASLTNYVNTGGTVRVGVDRSTGGFSGSAYAYFVSVALGRNIQNVVNGTAITSVSSTGLAVTGTTSTTTGMAVGGATAGAGGIAFPATAVAVADVNTLDDYEEGTFTPVLSFGNGTTGITYSIQSGSYTKIGDRVEWSCYITLTSKGSSTGTAAISGLPFASANSDNAYASVSVRASVVTYAGMIMAVHLKNSATVSFEQLSEAGSNTNLTDANFANTSGILLSGSHRV